MHRFTFSSMFKRRFVYKRKQRNGKERRRENKRQTRRQKNESSEHSLVVEVCLYVYDHSHSTGTLPLVAVYS